MQIKNKKKKKLARKDTRIEVYTSLPHKHKRKNKLNFEQDIFEESQKSYKYKKTR